MFPVPLVAVLAIVLSGCAGMDGLSVTPASAAAPLQAGESGPGSITPTLPSATAASPSGPPPSSEFIEERARQAYETGRWDVAEGYYLQLTRIKPRDANPWFQLGNLYAEQGRLDSAERAYRESLRRRDEARTLHNLGLVQVRLGVGALRESQKRLPPNDPARQETREFLRTLLEAAAQ
jgi:tetratricopeptide (TPR) repeat protein